MNSIMRVNKIASAPRGRWSVEEMTEVKWVTIQMGRRAYPY